jgi:hypothetical protein
MRRHGDEPVGGGVSADPFNRPRARASFPRRTGVTRRRRCIAGVPSSGVERATRVSSPTGGGLGTEAHELYIGSGPRLMATLPLLDTSTSPRGSIKPTN